MNSLLLEISSENLFKTLVIAGAALTAVWLVFAVICGFKKRNADNGERLSSILRITGLIVAGIVAVFGIIMLVVNLSESGIVPKLTYPIMGITVATVFCALLAVLGGKFKPEKAELFRKIAVIVFIVVVAICFILIYDYYKTEVGGEESGIDELWLIVSCVVLTLIPIVIMAGSKDVLNTRAIVFGAVSIALSFTLSYWAPWKLPQGGSITIAALAPLLIYSFYFGPKRGVVICFAYGLLQAIQDAYIIHPAQMLLDYPVAYCFIGMTGIFRKLIKNDFVAFGLGAVAASFFRFVCHVFSGVFAFASYAPEGMSPWIYSMGYNSFVFVDIAIAVAVGLVLMTSKDLRKMFSSYSA